MSPRGPVDHRLALRPVDVNHIDGRSDTGAAEGNNAAWMCACGRLLVGRCYFQFGDTCHTQCEVCNRRYRVIADRMKKAAEVREVSE